MNKYSEKMAPRFDAARNLWYLRNSRRKNMARAARVQIASIVRVNRPNLICDFCVLVTQFELWRGGAEDTAPRHRFWARQMQVLREIRPSLRNDRPSMRHREARAMPRRITALARPLPQHNSRPTSP